MTEKDVEGRRLRGVRIHIGREGGAADAVRMILRHQRLLSEVIDRVERGGFLSAAAAWASRQASRDKKDEGQAHDLAHDTTLGGGDCGPTAALLRRYVESVGIWPDMRAQNCWRRQEAAEPPSSRHLLVSGLDGGILAV